jgi:hypothetical protein
MVAVPRPEPEEAFATYPAADGKAPGQIAVFDPNKPLSTAITWR